MQQQQVDARPLVEQALVWASIGNKLRADTVAPMYRYLRRVVRDRLQASSQPKGAVVAPRTTGNTRSSFAELRRWYQADQQPSTSTSTAPTRPGEQSDDEGDDENNALDTLLEQKQRERGEVDLESYLRQRGKKSVPLLKEPRHGSKRIGRSTAAHHRSVPAARHRTERGKKRQRRSPGVSSG